MTAEITPETLRLASNGAGILEFYCRLPEAKAVWELVAHATETCEWTKTESGNYRTSCGLTAFNAWIGGSWKYCQCCGKRIKETNFALTETPRPATTGERDGGEIK